ncbi:hypothetical protein Plano_2819 [Planococcus sp. PAMC 21323]|uniref:hypothetical protein n=1 Tax=Planococcus sp. PAMC 21323 TaxID=1526927 RepID=UPI00056F1E57|nr:hypothetical protein [Planococcus sp. PAMC 21323]AIY06784.1 hypothetical protein Plano_2819 [Planococcus sp. PAMC 21323]
MNRFDMSFKNKKVKVYFVVMLPLIFIATLLTFVLPIEFQPIASLIVILGLVGYLIWFLVDRKKDKPQNGHGGSKK